MKKRRTSPLGPLRALLLPAAAAAVLLCFATALDSLDRGRSEENLRQLEEALRRGCVACYAAEGVYPPDLDYLKERYGVQVDENRYACYYSMIGPNLMPDITVLERTP